MPFSSDDPKPGPGRPKGSVAKRTQLLRELLDSHGINPVEQLMACIAQVKDPKDRGELWAKVIPFYYPKLNAITIEAKSPEAIEVETMSLQDLENKARQILEKSNVTTLEIKPGNSPQAQEAKAEEPG